MADNLKSIPISSLPEAETLETDDQIIAYRSDNGKAYRSNVGGLGETAQGAISDAFSTTKTYSAGDYCIYNDTLYKFTADKDIGAWDEDVVEKTTATAEIQSNTDLIDSFATITSETATSSSYISSGTCYYYRCGNFVMISFWGNINYNAIGTSNTDVTVLSGLPVPPRNDLVIIQPMSSNCTGLICRITTNGNIIINNSSSAMTGTATYTYIGGVYLTNG